VPGITPPRGLRQHVHGVKGLDSAAFRHLCQGQFLTNTSTSRPFARSHPPSQVCERRNSADFAISFRVGAPYARMKPAQTGTLSLSFKQAC
jgi:hypothetical protein